MRHCSATTRLVHRRHTPTVCEEEPSVVSAALIMTPSTKSSMRTTTECSRGCDLRPARPQYAKSAAMPEAAAAKSCVSGGGRCGGSVGGWCGTGRLHCNAQSGRLARGSAAHQPTEEEEDRMWRARCHLRWPRRIGCRIN
eukprot:scaffold128027_cov31-Tisochrysis_lutea.AAC.3